MNLKTIFLILSAFLLTSCKTDNKQDSAESKTISAEKVPSLKDEIEDKNISVLEETKNDSLKKVVVNLQLNEKIGEDDLKKIAKKIRKFEDKHKYKNLWIFYFLKGTKENSGAWATTHYSPDLEVKILGATNEEEKKSILQLNSDKGKIIGKWYEEQYTSSSLIIYEENGKYFGKTIFKNGQEMVENLEKKEITEGTKYFDKDNGVGEYYVVLKNGELGFYNKENKQYSTGRIIE